MNNNLGKILTDLREKKGYTQKDLANKLNVSDKAVSHWETGNSLPHVDTLVRISKLFKINLQDLIIAAASTDESDDNLVQDIIKEFTRRDENKSKLIKMILVITLAVILILGVSIIFTHSYNRFKVYNVAIDSDTIYYSKGIYVETKIKDSLFLSNIRIRNYVVKDTDNVVINLYYIENDKEYILQTYADLYNISFINYDSYIPINDLSNYIDKLYLRIKIINNKNEEKEYVGKLQFTLDFSNNKVFYNDYNKKAGSTKMSNLSSQEIERRLLANGFEKISDDVLEKKINNCNVHYIISSNMISINCEENNYLYRYNYKINKNILVVNIFNNNNIEVENYEYDVNNNKIIRCNIGSCNSYDKVMKHLDKYVLNHLK